MKILILADTSSIHTIRWANALFQKGVEVALFGFSNYNSSDYCNGIKIYSNQIPSTIISKKDGDLSKLIYLKSIAKVKNIIEEFKPDLLHSYYTSSYGFVGALVNFHPFFISVWGADIYNFPVKSIIHRIMVKFSLKRADKILSTSHSMVHQIQKFTKSKIEVTPFGIDVNIFKPLDIESIFGKEKIVIGTVKTLEKKYGVEYLIQAFKLVKDNLPFISFKLLIVGGGSQLNQLKKLTKELKLENDTIFTGYVKHNEVVKYYNMIDIYVALSIEDSESFGVAVLEASACEKPVVVSNISGFKEVVENNITGFIVEKQNIEQTANSIIKLVNDRNLRNAMGKSGRERVIKLYNWNNNVNQMINFYSETVNLYI